ncbi:MAG TPA: hypothetical protein DCR95_00120 [Desulfobacter sp.]|uniref:hypothetical protein n=1 Tax=Desulfobacter sp. UBA2225 TaxID=1961413 RepID=UPI000E9C2431|nr:hypothetical protein [Desulfobacter sp. UBA2225]HAR32536.1 hypothetical protein [Desulfobacter sp.]
MIVKSENKSNFTILSNAVLLDETISDKARGTLVRLLCRPENWNLNINHLVKSGKDGNTAIRSAIRELEDAGYIQRDVTRHENGRIVGVEYIIHESPVNSCGDRPAPEQRASSCKGTVLPERPDNEDAEPELITLGDPEPEPSTMPIQAKKAHIEDANIAENHMSKTVIKQTAPIINTDIKQILRVTTTTCAREAEPVICDQVLSLPSSSSPTHEIINLIPSQHRSPVVLSLVNKAIVDYPEREVKEAIAYAGANVRGGSMQYKAYLDKTLKNKWAVGFLESMQGPGAYGSAWVHPRAKFPNGTVTGNKAMDTNCMVAAQFLMEMGVDVDAMCAEA